MRLVVVESPFAGDVEKNIEYARMCLRDCFLRGAAPPGKPFAVYAKKDLGRQCPRGAEAWHGGRFCMGPPCGRAIQIRT